MSSHLHAALTAVAFTGFLAGPADAQRVVDLPTEDRPLVAEVERAWSVGGAAAPEWAAFDSQLRMDFGPDGALYVRDERNRRVVVIEDGGLRAELGRAGGGPGEFEPPRELAVLPDGGLVVYDVVQRRLSRFSRDGRFLNDAPANVGVGTPLRIFPHPGGGVIGLVRVFWVDGQPSTRSPAGISPTDGTPIQFYPLDDAGGPAVLHQARIIRRPADARGRPLLAAFFPEVVATALSDGRVAVADTAAWEVTLVEPSGGVGTVLRRPLPHRPVTERDRRAERERLLANLAQGRAPEAVASFGDSRPTLEELRARFEERIRDMRFPDTFPHVRALAADHEGRLWIERTGADPHGPGPIDVATADGRYLGTLPAGEPRLPLAFGPGGLVAWIETDDLDVPTIHVGRVRLSAGG